MKVIMGGLTKRIQPLGQNKQIRMRGQDDLNMGTARDQNNFPR